MKYSDVKDKIEKYFREVNPDRLYDLAISCGFKQVDKRVEEELQEEVSFENRSITHYKYVVLEKSISHKDYKFEDDSDYLATA